MSHPVTHEGGSALLLQLKNNGDLGFEHFNCEELAHLRPMKFYSKQNPFCSVGFVYVIHGPLTLLNVKELNFHRGCKKNQLTEHIFGV